MKNKPKINPIVIIGVLIMLAVTLSIYDYSLIDNLYLSITNIGVLVVLATVLISKFLKK